jgi:hypothetical protein
MIDSGWQEGLWVLIDTWYRLLRVSGVRIVEDPCHPESWLRDVLLQWWDRAAGWQDGPRLLSDSADHSHYLSAPVTARRFRLVTTGGPGWPVGNLRFTKLAFQAEVLGCSHPDAVAGNATAVLFDEDPASLAVLLHDNAPVHFPTDGGYSGRTYLAVGATRPGTRVAPVDTLGPGMAIPDWDFPIVDAPLPGQYRYLQFAWRAASSTTTGIHVLVGKQQNWQSVAISAGDLHVSPIPWNSYELFPQQHHVEEVPMSWEQVTADLWATAGGPMQVRAMHFYTTGGPAHFDRIVLTRTDPRLTP